LRLSLVLSRVEYEEASQPAKPSDEQEHQATRMMTTTAANTDQREAADTASGTRAVLPATTTIQSNVVAESDLEAACRALRQRITSSTRIPRDVDPDVLGPLLDACSASLAEKLERIVHAVGDEAYHEYLYKTTSGGEEEEDKKDVGNRVSSSSAKGDSAADEVEEEEDGDDMWFDESELLDEKALERVRELRRQVRDQAGKVKSLRGEVLGRAVELAQRQVKVWTDAASATADREADADAGEGSNSENLKQYEETVSAKVREMESSLQQLKDALEATQQALPEKLGQLQETVATIESSLSSSAAAGEGGNAGGMSHTERAIVRRDNEGGVDYSAAAATKKRQQQNWSDLPPQEQLANHLRD